MKSPGNRAKFRFTACTNVLVYVYRPSPVPIQQDLLALTKTTRSHPQSCSTGINAMLSPPALHLPLTPLLLTPTESPLLSSPNKIVRQPINILVRRLDLT